MNDTLTCLLISGIAMAVGFGSDRPDVAPPDKNAPPATEAKTDMKNNPSTPLPRLDAPEAATSLSALREQRAEILRRLDRSRAADTISQVHVRSLRAWVDALNLEVPLLAWSHGSGEGNLAQELAKIAAWQERVLAGLPEAGFDLPTHLATGMPLLLGFVSKADGSMQFATLQLPPDFSPDRVYPLVCYLHGAGPQKPVDFLDTAVNNRQQDTLWLSGDEEWVRQSGQRQCVLLAPYARGTRRYKHMAEADVWQALDIVQALVKTDPDRRYLTGFSMGGAGTYALAVARPDMWAAISIASASVRKGMMDVPETMGNLKGMPTILWCGETDTRLANMRRVEALWKDAGISVHSFTVAAGVGHAYPYADFDRVLKACFKFARPAVESFSYRYYSGSTDNAGEFRPIGRNGIWLETELGPLTEALAYTVRHANNAIAIELTGTARAVVIVPEQFENFAPTLDRQKPVRVAVNGKEVYAGMLGEKVSVKLDQL